MDSQTANRTFFSRESCVDLFLGGGVEGLSAIADDEVQLLVIGNSISTTIEMEYTDLELKKQIDENAKKLNNKGLKKLSDYSADLVAANRYLKDEDEWNA